MIPPDGAVISILVIASDREHGETWSRFYYPKPAEEGHAVTFEEWKPPDHWASPDEWAVRSA